MKTAQRTRPAALLSTVAILSLALAACGSSDDESTDAGSGAAADGTPVQIEYLHRLPDGDGMVKVADLVAEWNENNPDIQVSATKFDGDAGEMNKKLETDVNAGVGLCLAQADYAQVPEMYAKGLTTDVTEFAEQYQDNYSAAFDAVRVGESIVGLPQDTGPLVYYYNAAEFDRLGLTVPTTAEEFIATAQEAAAEGKYIAAFQPDETRLWLSGQAAAAGSQWYTAEDDQWVVDVNDEGSQRVADFWQELFDTEATVSLERWSDGFSSALVEQELIGTIGAAWEAPLLADTMAGTDNDGEWAVTQLFDFGAGDITGPDGGSAVVVLSGCEHPAEAMEFLNWFNSQTDALVSQGLVVASTAGEMTTPDSLASFYGDQDVFAELAEANERLSTDWTYMPFFSSVEGPMREAAAAAGAGEGPMTAVFEAGQTQSVATLTEANIPVAE